jgi:hypothetical protein
VSDDVNRASAQTGEEVFASWQVSPRLDRWRDVLNSQLLPLFGATGQGVEFDYVYPMPQNREQDALELTTKANAALALITAGYDQHDVLQVVGLPDMQVALNLTSEPALPPRWTLGLPPPTPAPAKPAAASAAKTPPDASAGAGDDETAASGGQADGKADAAEAALRHAAGWDSPAWRELAAWNRVGAP